MPARVRTPPAASAPFSRCYTIALCRAALHERVPAESTTPELDVVTAFLHAVKGAFNGYRPVHNARGAYSAGFYATWMRNAFLDEVAHARTFVQDMDDRVLRLSDVLSARVLVTGRRATEFPEYAELVAQIVSDANEYVELLSHDERTVLCMNVAVDFERGEAVATDRAAQRAYCDALAGAAAPVPRRSAPAGARGAIGKRPAGTRRAKG